MKQFLLLLLASWFCLSASEQICSNGFKLYGQKCLALVRQQKNWYDAEQMCRFTDGAFLAQPKTLEEYNNVLTLLSTSTIREVWMGLKCNSTNKAMCQWDDTTMLNGFEKFDTGYPNGQFQCTQFYAVGSNGLYYSRPCDLTMPFVCELPPTERDCETNCGVSYNGYCYKLWDRRKTFDDAEAYCKQYNAHLVSIHSYPEFRFVAQLFRDEGSYYIGGKMDGNEQITWIDGSTGVYTMGNKADGGNCVQFGVDSTGSGTYYYGRDCYSDTIFFCKRPARCDGSFKYNLFQNRTL